VAAAAQAGTVPELEGVLMLPRLPCDLPGTEREILALQGINYSDSCQDGDLAACENLSTRRYPYFSTRRARTHLAQYDGATALTAWEKLVVVKGTRLYYDGAAVGTVTAGEKQFAVVNTRLVIWPDKKYLDLQERTLGSLDAKIAAERAVFTADTVTLTGAPVLTDRFRAGDTVTISGCTALPDNNKAVHIVSLTGKTITVPKDAFQAGSENHTVTIERRVPDLDYICESENRLWGCSNSERTIFASALGDPCNFYSYNGVSTDSYALSVGSEGPFTGCCALSGGVLFWKERTLHKMLGSYPAEYSLHSYSVEGLKAGCHKSMAVVNEVLYYLGSGGVYAYAGGTPQRISAALGDRPFSDGRGGTDGERYYLSVQDGQVRQLLVYDTRRQIWLREDDMACVDFARLGNEVYFLTRDGKVCLADSGQEDPEVAWMAQFTPFYETIQGRKRYSRLILRMELPKGAWMEAEARSGGGRWESCGKKIGQVDGVVTMVLPARRRDKWELRLRGEGPCTILGVLREFTVGSER